MTIAIEIELGNDAMRTARDVVDALTLSFAKTTSVPLFDALPVGASGVVADRNGNTVGRWSVEESAS